MAKAKAEAIWSSGEGAFRQPERPSFHGSTRAANPGFRPSDQKEEGDPGAAATLYSACLL